MKDNALVVVTVLDGVIGGGISVVGLGIVCRATVSGDFVVSSGIGSGVLGSGSTELRGSSGSFMVTSLGLEGVGNTKLGVSCWGKAHWEESEVL